MEDNERLRAIWARTVEKLEEVVYEFKITQDELHIAGNYFNRLGQSGMCRSLIDVALAMTSIDATVAGTNGTRPNLEGPYHGKHPLRPDGNLLDRDPGPESPRLVLSGVVTNAVTGAAVPGALLDFWQADSEGHYDLETVHLRGVVAADAEGRYRVSTVVPFDYSEHDHDPIGELFRAMGRHNRRAAHLHLKVSTGRIERLTTQLFIAGSPYLDSDYVEGAVSPDLVIQLEPELRMPGAPPAYRARFDVALDGLPQ
jgi:protocatechuate 3,4-dioxygenase beta subunit